MPFVGLLYINSDLPKNFIYEQESFVQKRTISSVLLENRRKNTVTQTFQLSGRSCVISQEDRSQEKTGRQSHHFLLVRRHYQFQIFYSRLIILCSRFKQPFKAFVLIFFYAHALI